MSVAEAVQTTSKASSSSSSGFVVARKCVCGGSAGFSGECEECKRRKMLGRPLQPTHAINEPDDEYEREADRVAEQVMRMPEPARESDGAGLRVPPLVQRRVSGAGRRGAGAAPSLVDEVLASPSQPLDAAARTFLEPRFGESLHDVRLHTDVRAQQAARSIDARAFTVGRHIVLGAREYLPHSTAGTHLLAHELTHVMQQTGGASVLARKSSPALSWSGSSPNLNESAAAVTEDVVADQAEYAAEVTGASSTSELGRLDTARPDQQTEQPEAVFVEQPAFPQAEPAPLIERLETSATLKAAESSAARPAVGVEVGTPSEIGRQFNALPPSIQAETYGRLGAAQRTSFANQALETQASITELSASLDGVTELPATPLVRTPPLAPSVAGHALPNASEPVVQIPQAPARPPVSHPALPTAQAAEPKALEQALGAIDQTSVIATTLERPAIPLEGTADPAALGTLESTAADEAARSLDAARAGVLDVSPEIVQPLVLDEVVAVPALADVDLAEPTPQIEGMDKLAAYALSPRDREIVDARIGPSMQDAAAGAQSELDQHEQAFDQERTRLHMEADTEAAAAQARAEEDQRSEVEQGRQGLDAEQEQTLAQQQAAVDGALGDLAKSREASRQTIDDRLATDRATVDEVYRAAETDAQTAVDKGQAEAGALKGATVDKVNAESWWDWAIDTWQGFVQWFASQLVALWERVNQTIAGLFDRAIQLATRVVNGAVAFVKLALSAYYDFWIRLVDKLLGNTFPALAAAFRTAAEAIKAAVFAALDAVAAAYLKALRFVADTLVAGLDAGLLAYQTGVTAYLALWEAIQQGQWDQIGRTVLTALLTAVGIDPAEFFATFSKLDEVVDDVIADPGVVGRNAVAAVALGFQQFGTHFIGNFTAAFVEWITGAAAIKLPETFSLAGIFDVVCQVLNLSKAYLHKKAVQHLGEGAVTAIEELTEAAWAFVSSGWAGLWNLVKEKLTTLVDDVVVATGTWLVEKAILVAGRWIAGLAATMGLSVIVEALIALWQFVMWLKDQFHRFWMIVKSTIDSVHDFVKGKIEPAADKIEGTLQDLIVPAIDLVAKLLNISNIAKKVEHIIEAVRGVIDGAIDGVIHGLKKTLGLDKKKPVAKSAAGSEGGRHGTITLATLKEPPVALPRTKEEEIEDLQAAHKVLKVAAVDAGDTAQLAEYFEPTRRRFRLKSLGYDEIGGQTGVKAAINPEMAGYYALTEREFPENKSPLGETRVESVTRQLKWTDSSKSSFNDTVATQMVAAPLGPDHRQGNAPKQSALRAVMGQLETATGNEAGKKFIKGHLLNDNAGGPGTADNLYPITAAANAEHEKAIENWVKTQIKARYYLYYKVEIVEGDSKLDGSLSTNYVDSVIRAEAGFWKTEKPHWDPGKVVKATIRSHADIGSGKLRDANRLKAEAPGKTSDADRPVHSAAEGHLERGPAGIESPDSKRKVVEEPDLARADEAADDVATYATFAREVARGPGSPSSVTEANRDLAEFEQSTKRFAAQCKTAVEAKNADAARQAADAAESQAQQALTVVGRLAEEGANRLAARVEEAYATFAAALDGTLQEIDTEYQEHKRTGDTLLHDARAATSDRDSLPREWAGFFQRLNKIRSGSGLGRIPLALERTRNSSDTLRDKTQTALGLIRKVPGARGLAESYEAATSASLVVISETQTVLAGARQTLDVTKEAGRSLTSLELQLADLKQADANKSPVKAKS